MTYTDLVEKYIATLSLRSRVIYPGPQAHSFQLALTCARPGDQIILKYDYEGAFCIQASGTKTRPIIIDANGHSITSIGNSDCLKIHGSNITVDSLKIIGGGLTSKVGSKNITLTGSYVFVPK